MSTDPQHDDPDHDRHPGSRPGLDITIRTGSGAGLTRLSAFDAALLAAGVANLNLVPLSSVIPPGSRMTRTAEPLHARHGDRLYCVLATAWADQPGETAWAGLGWARDVTTGGLFVEHHSGSRASLLEQIHLSLADMSANRGGGYDEVETVSASAHYLDRPACAVAVAAYEVAGWGR